MRARLRLSLLALFVVQSRSLADASEQLPPESHGYERSALLEFKQSFYNSSHEDCFLSWDIESRNDSCAWDRIECDQLTGRVVGLDLSNCFLAAPSINSSSSLFRLARLEKLDLSENDFNSSPIPPAVGKLSRLRVLKLSYCNFTGQVPPDILGLTNLSTLDMSWNNGLVLGRPYMEDLAQNLTKLEELYLDQVDISGPIPNGFANFSLLKSLSASFCNLQGKFPTAIFELPDLQYLILNSNGNLSGEFPASLSSCSSLRSLDIEGDSFHGRLPSFRNLSLLVELNLQDNAFAGDIPSSIRNLTMISYLYLNSNQLTGPIPHSLGDLGRLRNLDLSSNRLTGRIPPSLSNLSPIIKLDLSGNAFSGQIPSSIGNLTQLSELDISSNQLTGQIPSSLRNITQLFYLNLSRNQLTHHIADSLMELEHLDALDLRFNMLQGPLPSPPTSLRYYRVSSNKLSSEIPPLFCNLSRIAMLDLAKNSFTGPVPQCLSNLSSTLNILSIHDNNFSGAIPLSFGTSICTLRMMDFSQNQLEGSLPRSLKNCTELVFLDVESNSIEDLFPSWMASLPELRVLILRSNRFHGEIPEPTSEGEFPKLQIMDVSSNNLFGSLPFSSSETWKGMKVRNPNSSHYFGYSSDDEFEFSMTIINKGKEMVYMNTLFYFTGLDLSSNNFGGEIPSALGSLQGLRQLNLSNNLLTGRIPPELNGLKQLEALDLSQNRLSGEIPLQLTDLTYLGTFNVSYNQLSGSIPREKQFITFDNSSYIGNAGLCGDPLSKKCGISDQGAAPLPQSIDNQTHSDNFFEVDWKIILIGFASGIVIGVALGQGVSIRQDNWVVRMLRYERR